jgi:hypothetical protein
MRYVMDARDNLSGFVEAKAIKKKTGRAIAEWVEDLYLRYPFIQRFVADNGKEFKCEEVMKTLERLGVPILFIPTYHPESNSPVERGHSTLKNVMAKWCAENMTKWPEVLTHAAYAENVTIKRTTGMTPNMLWFGREANFPIESIIKTWGRVGKDLTMEEIISRFDSSKDVITEEEIVKAINQSELTSEDLIAIHAKQIAQQDEALDEVVDKVVQSRMKDKKRWDAQRYIRDCPLQIGYLVIEYNSARESTWSKKLECRWRGPFRIKDVFGNGTYRVAELDGAKSAQIVSGSRLRKFLLRDPAFDALHFCYEVTN